MSCRITSEYINVRILFFLRIFYINFVLFIIKKKKFTKMKFKKNNIFFYKNIK